MLIMSRGSTNKLNNNWSIQAGATTDLDFLMGAHQ